MTLPQIYSTFNTAPQMTLLGASTAMWATVTLVGTAVYSSWNFGFNVGTQYVLPVVQYYTPNLYDAIGGTIDSLIDMYRNADGPDLGNIERDSTPPYNLQPISYNYMEETGGPYGVAMEWSAEYGGGGCRGRRSA